MSYGGSYASAVRMQYKTPYTKDMFSCPKRYLSYTISVLLTSEKRTPLSIKDKNCWFQGVLYIEVPLYNYDTVLSVHYGV